MEVFLLNAHNRTNEQRIMPTKQHQMARKNRMYLLRNHIAFQPHIIIIIMFISYLKNDIGYVVCRIGQQSEAYTQQSHSHIVRFSFVGKTRIHFLLIERWCLHVYLTYLVLLRLLRLGLYFLSFATQTERSFSRSRSKLFQQFSLSCSFCHRQCHLINCPIAFIVIAFACSIHIWNDNNNKTFAETMDIDKCGSETVWNMANDKHN